MLFRFLRRYLPDDEYENTLAELTETKQTLADYRQFIQQGRKQLEYEKEKVDPDYLTFIWTSFSVALAFFFIAFKRIPLAKGPSGLTEAEWVWFMLAAAMLIFIALNIFFAIQLTITYAASKSNKGYRFFSISIIAMVLIVITGILAIGIFNTPTP